MIEESSSKRIPELDGIRGLAISMVVIYHYGYLLLDGKTSWFNANFRYLTKYFYTGVDLFFILSGFLLGGILVANKGKTNYFRTFYIRRFCRILPIYFASILAVYIIYISGVGMGTAWSYDSKVPWYSYLLFIQNFFMIAYETFGNKFLIVTWSLAVEEQFYLVLPLLTYFLNRKWLIAVLCICIISAPFFRFNAVNFYETFGMVYCRFDSLFAGVLIAIAVKNDTFISYCIRYKNLLGSILVLLFGVSLLLSFRILQLEYNNICSWFSLVWAVFIIVVVTNKESVFSLLMRNKFLITAGKYSYGIYIYHHIVLGLLFLTIAEYVPKIDTLNDVLIVLSSVISTFILSYLSYHYFEKKIIAFGHKFRY